ncbi:MAG: DUF4234 domain-containing protein [Eubacterium sp.]|nr:DUF4234 domain-containing protein [Eubacterium sp.]
MSKFSNSVSKTLDKFKFNKIRVVTISLISVAIFFMFTTIYMPTSGGFSVGLTATLINLLLMAVMIALLVFVITNSDFGRYFITVIIYGVVTAIAFLVTIINFIAYIDIYNKSLQSSDFLPESKDFFTANMVLYILDIISFIAVIVALVFLLICIKKRQSTNSKTSFAIPLFIFIGYFVISVVYFIILIAFDFKYSMMQSVTTILISASWVYFTIYLETRPKVTADYIKQSEEVRDSQFSASLKDNKDYGFMNTGIVLHFFLTIITCGIWNYIGIFKLTRYLSSMNKEYYRDPVTKLLLCMFVPFYSYYWYYKSGVIVDKLNKIPNGKSGALLCILSIFFPGASFLVLINKAQGLEFTMPPQNDSQNINTVQ